MIRYEDMQHDTFATFTQAVRYLQLTTEPEKIAKAIQHADFKALQAQEQQTPFKKRPPKTQQFFRKGIR